MQLQQLRTVKQPALYLLLHVLVPLIIESANFRLDVMHFFVTYLFVSIILCIFAEEKFTKNQKQNND